MAVIAVVGGPGAPGATTTALAMLLAWPLPPGRRMLLVEADPDGGAVLAGALEGRVEAVYGLRNLAIADRRGLLAQTIWEQLIDLSPEGNADRLLLPGLTDPTQAPGLAYTWEPLSELLHGVERQGYDVIVDLGRSGATGHSAVLARRADVVAATVRTTLRGLSSARPRLAALAEDLASAGTGPDALGLLLVSEGPYSRAEVSRELGLPVLGVLPHAARTARVLSDGGDTTDRRFIRSELMRTARSAADEVQLLVRRRRQRLAPGAAPAQLTAGGPAGAPGSAAAPAASVPPASPIPAQPVPSAPQPPMPVPSSGPSSAPSPAPGRAPAPGPYGQPGYGQGGQAQGPYAQTPYAQAPHTQAPYAQGSYGQDSYGPGGYGSAPQGQPAYGQRVPGPGPGRPAHARPAHARPAPGPSGYGTAAESEQPSYAPPQPVPPVITTGPVAPLAGLAPQPAAPAPFPAHVQSAPNGDADDQYPLQRPIVTNRQDDPNGPYPHNPGEVLRAR
ncbi:hypothetical protein ACFRAR_00415 [Kitasatospora sp. NPDC056651]|uniref:hypothetical protein n=1 Tax=Kitasatospora sp. NPDC056651 TaxID=3345892 RepID=UPI0036BCC336